MSSLDEEGADVPKGNVEATAEPLIMAADDGFNLSRFEVYAKQANIPIVLSGMTFPERKILVVDDNSDVLQVLGCRGRVRPLFATLKK